MPVLLIYRILFMIELFTAEFLYILQLKKKSYFALRFMLCVVIGCAATFALPLFYNAFYISLTFLLLFAVTVPMLKFCCDELWINVLFCGIAAYTTQHFAYGVANFLLSLIEWGRSPIFGMYFEETIDFSNFDNNTLLIALCYLLAYYVSYLFLYFAFGKKIKRGKNLKIKSIVIFLLVAGAFVVNIFLNAMVVYFGDSGNIATTLLNIVYESLCCFFLLHIQFGLIKTVTLENELDLMRVLLNEKERQYNLSKESIELINLKCHDLRHQIRMIGEGKGLSGEAVKEIEGAISIYDSKVETDNEVLDIILTEKSLKCAHEGIALTCVADGRALEFMDKADVYSLFGNALDNAIEAVTRLPQDRRNIGVVVRQVGDLVSINIHNAYEGTIQFDGDGLPVTTKENNGFHGIGMKSMRQIAEKYMGTMTVSVNEDTFIVNAIISTKTTEKVKKMRV